MNNFKTIFCTLLLLVLCHFSNAQNKSENQLQIETVLKNQVLAWNEGDIEKYMQGYWKSDSLVFIGKKGLTKGWKPTLENYIKSYPDKKAMGQLSFELLKEEALGIDHFLVIGKWTLNREKDILTGHFSLIWRKIEGQWFIVADHSS